MSSEEKLRKLLESNHDYWTRRSVLTTLDTIQKEEAYYKQLKAVYDSAQKELENKLSVIYNRYAKNNNMSNTEAYKVLSKKDAADYKIEVNKYLELAKEHAGDPQWEAYLLNQSLKHQYTVLDKLKTEWKNVAYGLDTKGELFLDKIYQNAAYQTQYNGEAADINVNFSTVSPEKLDRVLNEDWSGEGKFSELLWKNKEKLANALDDILVKGFAKGSSYTQMAKDLAKRMDVSYNAALRLIRTESTRMENQGLLDTYKQLGAEQFQFTAVLDDRTSDICASMDGQIFNIEDAEVGLNVPPLHPNCRSVITPYYGEDVKERSMRNPETGKSEQTEYKDYVSYLKDNLKDEARAEAIANDKADIATLTKAQPEQTTTVLSNPLIQMAIMNPSPAPLTSQERRAVNRYVSSDAYKINDSLRNSYTMSDDMKDMMNELDKALQKMEFYQGNVIRDITVDNLEEFLDNYQIGQIVPFKQYISASTDLSATFNSKPNVVYNIYSKTARDVRQYNAMESEVVFERDSNFLVLDIKYDESTNMLYISMEQVI